MRQFIMPLTLALASFGAFAGSETQNGGYGVETSQGLIVLDLVQRDSYREPNKGEAFARYLPTADRDAIAASLSSLKMSAEAIRIVQAKMAEFYARATYLGYSLPDYAELMAKFTFLRVEGTACLNVNDDQSPYPNKVQIAYREQSWVRFCKDFDRLDDLNKAALVVHEIIYLGLKEKSLLTQLVGLLFHKDFKLFEAPARKELAHILSTFSTWDLYRANLNKWTLWERRLSLSAELLSQFPVAYRDRVCLYKTRSVSEDSLYLWIAGLPQDCLFEGPLVKRGFPSQAVVLKSIPAQGLTQIWKTWNRDNPFGALHFDVSVAQSVDKEITKLCTYEYAATCSLQIQKNPFGGEDLILRKR